MNMAKLRQILESRRVNKMPPLLPPKRSKRPVDEGKRANQKEILDIHLQLRIFERAKSTNMSGSSIVCAFSESEEGHRGPWRVTTANEVLLEESAGTGSGGPSIVVDLANVFAVEFQLERQRFLRLDLCELLVAQNEASSVGYCFFSVAELVCSRTGKIQRKLINDEMGAEIAEAFLSCTLRPRPHAVVLQFAANTPSKKGIGSGGVPAQIFFEIHRIPGEDSSKEGPRMENNTNHHHQHNDSLYSNSHQGLNGHQKTTDSVPEGVDSSSSENNVSMLLYRSENVKLSAGRVVWRAFSLLSTDIGDSNNLKIVCLLKREQTSSPSSSSSSSLKPVEGFSSSPPQVLGEFITDFGVLRKGPGFSNVYFLNSEKSRLRTKSAGTFELCKLHEVCNPSFLEYIASGSTLNLSFAVDFSRSDSGVDEPTVRRYVEEVELAIGAFGEPLREFQNSNSYAAFGFGAKIPPQFRESQEFCLNLETDPYCRGLSSVLAAFKNAFVSVQALNVAHLSHVIYYVAKLAQNSVSRSSPAISSALETDYNPPAYFVLVIITRGVFDDLKETVQAIIFASRAPISIIFVGIGEEISKLERLATAGTRLNYHGRKPERECTQFVSVPACRTLEEGKLSDLKALIAERGLTTLAQQMCTWMYRNGYQKAPLNSDSLEQEIQTPRFLPPQIPSSAAHSPPQQQQQKQTFLETRCGDPCSPGFLSESAIDLARTNGNNNNRVLQMESEIGAIPKCVPVRKSTIAAVRRHFRDLELHKFAAISLPGSPRRFSSNSSLNVANTKNYCKKTRLGSSLSSTMHKHQFSGSRSASVTPHGDKDNN